MPGLRRLALLKTTQRRALVDSLTADPPVAAIAEFQERIAAALPNYDENQVRDLVAQVFGLLSTAASHGYEVPAVARQVAALPDLELGPQAAKAFAIFLERLLLAPGIRGLAKAADVATEHERVLHTSRILTDIRPVFDVDVDEPSGAVVTHTLRIEYFDAGALQAIEFSLNQTDLAQLREAVDREDRKGAAVERLLGRAGVINFRLNDPE